MISADKGKDAFKQGNRLCRLNYCATFILRSCYPPLSIQFHSVPSHLILSYPPLSSYPLLFPPLLSSPLLSSPHLSSSNCTYPIQYHNSFTTPQVQFYITKLDCVWSFVITYKISACSIWSYLLWFDVITFYVDYLWPRGGLHDPHGMRIPKQRESSESVSQWVSDLDW